MPEDGAVSEVDVVEPLNLVKMDDDDPLLNLSLERQILDRDRGSWRLLVEIPLEVTEVALSLQLFLLMGVIGSGSDQSLGIDSNSSQGCFCGLNQKLRGLGTNSSRSFTSPGWGRLCLCALPLTPRFLRFSVCSIGEEMSSHSSNSCRVMNHCQTAKQRQFSPQRDH